MNKIEISRNELLLSQDYESWFGDQSLNSEAQIMVEQGDGDCCSIRVFDDAIDDCSDCISFLLSKEDAPRFAQSVLLLSGAAQVVNESVVSNNSNQTLLDDVVRLFESDGLVEYDAATDSFVFTENGYDIPAKDMKDPHWILEWVAHMAEKSWVTNQHLYVFAKKVQEKNRRDSKQFCEQQD